MARSNYSPSPSPSLRSSTDFSDSSHDEDIGTHADGSELAGSASRPGSPMTAEASMLGEDKQADTMTCQWEDCGKVFSHLPTLIEHIHNGKWHDFGSTVLHCVGAEHVSVDSIYMPVRHGFRCSSRFSHPRIVTSFLTRCTRSHRRAQIQLHL